MHHETPANNRLRGGKPSRSTLRRDVRRAWSALIAAFSRTYDALPEHLTGGFFASPVALLPPGVPALPLLAWLGLFGLLLGGGLVAARRRCVRQE